jgi:hypothetical protein
MEFMNRLLQQLLKISPLNRDSTKEINWLLTNGKLSQKKKDILLSILENAKKEKEGDQETSSVGSESDHSSEDPFDVSNEVVAKNKEVPHLTLVNDAPDTSVIFMSPEEQREATLLESSEPDGIREIQLKKKFYEHYSDLFHGTEESSKR